MYDSAMEGVGTAASILAILFISIWAAVGFKVGYAYEQESMHHPYQNTVEYKTAVLNYEKVQIDKKLKEVK